MGNSFEDLDVWKAACRLSAVIIKEMQSCNVYGLRDQMVRSAISIPSNIAEGSERLTKKDFRHFIHISLGSAAELRTQIYIALEANILDKKKGKSWVSDLKILSRMLQALSTSLQKIK